ncbi:MAG TPA: hypothetical protein VGZ32_07155 [Actinocrinis sp.]|jgi:hypothetical protein|uniref:hypothetical protein n=1 Tax=Actinocrinis sp. TaxID=1920516 RepID=UPI002DDCDDA3|nr:hypothetical protein [Actinocrinis sp.]HEV3170099.1 hypothetical protein [Actinocrinis sp.]
MSATASTDDASQDDAAQTTKGPRPRGGRVALVLRLLLGAAGLAVLGNGVRGLLTTAHVAALTSVGRWLLGGLILHDGVLAPVVFTVCALAYRRTGPRLRRALAAILLIGGSVVLVALPEFLLPPGNPNPTVHPLNYARGLAIVLGSVIAAALLPLLLSAARDRRRARRRARAEALEESLQTEEASPSLPEAGPNPGPDA